jgi:hypothetical protein
MIAVTPTTIAGMYDLLTRRERWWNLYERLEKDSSIGRYMLNVNPLKSKGMACHIAYGSDGRLFIYLWADVENGATMACEESQ